MYERLYVLNERKTRLHAIGKRAYDDVTLFIYI